MLIQPAASATDFNGYLRSGVGSNDSGGDQVCFKLPAAPAKYRLGNECETYGELSLSHKLVQNSDGSYFKLTTTLAFAVAADQDWETYTPSWRQVYIESGSLFSSQSWKTARFWAGKKFYRRHDAHINDFFFWDNSGPGAGVEDISLKHSRLAYAWRRNTSSDDRAITQHDLRWYQLNSNPNGQLTLGLNLIQPDQSQPGLITHQGQQLHILHQQTQLFGATNTLALQYGIGAGASLDNTVDDTIDDSQQTVRLVEQLLFNSDQHWRTMLVYIHEHKQHIQRWQSVGIRPIYYFSEHFSLALELGHDNIRPDNGPEQQLSKITIAPQLSATRGFWARPVLRAFISYADWNNAAQQSAVAGDTISSTGVFGSSTQGMTIGFQAEAWW